MPGPIRIPARALLAIAPLLAASVAPGVARAASPQAVTGTFAPEHGAQGAITGRVSGEFDPDTDVLTYTATYAGLSGPVAAAHFHGPARHGAEAGVMQPIAPPYDSPIRGRWTLTPVEAHALAAGEVYVNLHTAAFPGGEARADLSVH